MSYFLRHYERFEKETEKDDLQVIPAVTMRFRFKDEIEIFENEDARQKILQHPKCPFKEFAFVGECEIDRTWYYIAANGSLYSSTTTIILLEK